jgi:hypothetical protein
MTVGAPNVQFDTAALFFAGKQAIFLEVFDMRTCKCGRPTMNLRKCGHCLEREDEEGLRHGAPSTRQAHYVRARRSRCPRYYGPRPIR